MTSPHTERLDAIDFALGLLNAADERAPGFLLDSRSRLVDAAFASSALLLQQLIENHEVEGLELAFRIAPDPVHGDSSIVQETMASLAGMQYLRASADTARYYRFCRDPYPNAKAFHYERRTPIPGSFDLYHRLTSEFLTTLTGTTVEPLTTGSTET